MLFDKKNISSLLLVICFLVAAGCEGDKRTPEQKVEEERIEKEFKSIFSLNTDSIDISSLSLYGFGGLEIKNKSKIKWDELYVILNPPISEPVKDDAVGVAKSLWEYGVFSLLKEGFRSPSDTNKAYANTVPGEGFRIPWSDFIHTKTKEKFSPNRYDVSAVFVHVVIKYKGRTFEESNIFTFK